METSTKFDIVGHLPAEIVQQILFDLSPEDLNSATFCCASWSAAVSNDYFWKRLCKRDGHLEVEESERSEFYNNFLKKYNYWQGVYWYNYTLQRNWETNNYREDIYEIKQSGVYDSTNGLWNFGDVIAFSQVDRDGYNMHVCDLKRDEETIFVIKNDRGEPIDLLRSGNYLVNIVTGAHSITVWDYVNGTTIFDFEDKVWNYGSFVFVDKDLIVMHMYKMEFEVVNIETREIGYKYTGDFKNLILNDGKIIFLKDNVINILKWSDKSIVPLTCCQSVSNRKLLVKNDLLLSVCNGTVCIWNTTTNTKLHSILLGPILDLYRISLIGKYFYVERYNDAEKNCVIEFWDYMKGTSEVAIVASINQYIYSSSNDHFMVSCDSLNIWCLRTRNFIPILNTTLASHNQYGVVLTKTKLTYVTRFAKEEYKDDTITISQKDYEI